PFFRSARSCLKLHFIAGGECGFSHAVFQTEKRETQPQKGAEGTKFRMPRLLSLFVLFEPFCGKMISPLAETRGFAVPRGLGSPVYIGAKKQRRFVAAAVQIVG